MVSHIFAHIVVFKNGNFILFNFYVNLTFNFIKFDKGAQVVMKKKEN